MIQLLNFIHQYDPGSAARTLLLLHGTGGNEHSLLDLGRSIDLSANLLSPRGKVTENGMPRFFRRLSEGVFDEADLRTQTEELANFIEAAAQHYRFDPAKVTAVGYSNGANIAGGLLLLRPGIVQSAILFRPMVPLVPEPRPELNGVPVWIAAGSHDPIARPTETKRLATLLREAGADVKVSFVDADHGLTRAEIESAKRWLESLPS